METFVQFFSATLAVVLALVVGGVIVSVFPHLAIALVRRVTTRKWQESKWRKWQETRNYSMMTFHRQYGLAIPQASDAKESA